MFWLSTQLQLLDTRQHFGIHSVDFFLLNTHICLSVWLQVKHNVTVQVASSSPNLLYLYILHLSFTQYLLNFCVMTVVVIHSEIHCISFIILMLNSWWICCKLMEQLPQWIPEYAHRLRPLANHGTQKYTSVLHLVTIIAFLFFIRMFVLCLFCTFNLFKACINQ